ncbi:MAG: Uma2 family endonuclease [Desulfobacteraceae bacterium]|nr:Uma2 family endonuclease [Desulfobacteraceae bacterium]
MKALEKKEAKRSGERIFRVVPRKDAGPELRKEIIYPESDGKPMSDNTKQYRWIVKIKEGIESLFADDADVFVAADLLWYPVEGKNKTRAAPDVMVAFGRPKGDRGSYLQWKEDNIAPQAVFEILSPGNTPKEMNKKFKFYERHGVEEYYIYDPDRIEFKGWTRSGKRLLPIKNTQGWVSPILKIRFEITNDELTVIRPDGSKFLSPLKAVEAERKKTEVERKKAEAEKKRAGKAEKTAEAERKKTEAEKKRAEKAVEAERKKAEAEKKRAEKAVEAERKKAEAERKKAGDERKKAEAERKRAGKAEKTAEAERKKARKLAEKLRALGIDPENL